jgi:hypothetical protein
MSRSSTPAQPTGNSNPGPRTASVRIVVESDGSSDQFPGRHAATPRNLSGVRTTARIVMAMVFLSGGLALFDLYLLLSGL